LLHFLRIVTIRVRQSRRLQDNVLQRSRFGSMPAMSRADRHACVKFRESDRQKM
jgi:hypothetical protein